MEREQNPDTQSYKTWLTSLKDRYRKAQIKASRSVNSELIQFYWGLGQDILLKEKDSSWGSGFLKQLSEDLQKAFPEVKGFSHRNIKYIRQWCSFYQGEEIGQQVVAQLASIPWGHNLVLVSKCQTPQEASFYIQHTLEKGWSRNVLVHQVESGLFQREGMALNNFQRTLPPAQSELAEQSLKDPYLFDFIGLANIHNERQLEGALIDHISKFLMELGTGFAYMGKQVPLQVGERDFYLDLLFYHARLHCYVVIELKVGEFEPEHAGKLNFYLKAVDEQFKSPEDHPSIGLLLVKSKDRVVAEYALSDIHKPMGISEYRLTPILPDELKNSLPSPEELRNKLEESEGDKFL